MPLYLVERYLPGLTADDLRAQVERERGLSGLSHLRTTYLPDDELCFTLVEAPSRGAVSQANELAEMTYERISEALEVPDQDLRGGIHV